MTYASAERHYTRERRKIRKAIEAKGRKLTSLTWEHWYNGGEGAGICSGWSGTFEPPSRVGNDFYGLSVADVLDWIEEFIQAAD